MAKINGLRQRPKLHIRGGGVLREGSIVLRMRGERLRLLKFPEPIEAGEEKEKRKRTSGDGEGGGGRGRRRGV